MPNQEQCVVKCPDWQCIGAHEQSKDEEQGKTGEDDNSEDQRIVRIFVCLLRVDLADDFDLESLALLYLEAILGDKEIVGPEGHEHIVCINWVR